MHERYPAPHAEAIWAPQGVITRWHNIATEFAASAAAHAKNPSAVEALKACDMIEADTVRQHELELGHDVVAFLRTWIDMLPEEAHPYVHYGLTSSDIVDNAHLMALRLHTRAVLRLAEHLREVLRDLSNDNDHGVCPGRTHGQIAEATTWRHRWRVHLNPLDAIIHDMHRCIHDMDITKTPGPTGYSVVRQGIDTRNNWYPSTQIVPRDFQLRWAGCYLRLAALTENLAGLVRAGSRSEVGELREGATGSRVGSSAMPGKSNPIGSEKICGLARVARGNFMAIAESVATEFDRDISNSSVERTAVPDLAATVEYMVEHTTTILANLIAYTDRMRSNLDMYAATNMLQAMVQKHGRLDPLTVSRRVREVMVDYLSPAWITALASKYIPEANRDAFIQECIANWGKMQHQR